MIRRLILCLCILGASVAAPVSAAPAATARTTAKKTTVKKAAAKKAAPRKSSAVAAKPDAAPAPTRTVAAPRRLEDIHIEGEIPAPQVLFVTARDQRRFTRFHHDRYLKTSAQVGQTTLLPNRVAVSPPTTPAGQP